MSSRQACCAGCRSLIGDTGESMRCGKCKQVFDLLCANFTENIYATFSTEFKNSWICVECRSKIPKGDNSHTPVRQHLMHDMSIASDCPDVSVSTPDNVTVRTGMRYAQTTSQQELSFKALASAMQDLKEMQGNFEQRLTLKIENLLVEQFKTFKTEMFDKVNGLAGRIIELEERIALLNDPKKETLPNPTITAPLLTPQPSNGNHIGGNIPLMQRNKKNKKSKNASKNGKIASPAGSAPENLVTGNFVKGGKMASDLVSNPNRPEMGPLKMGPLALDPRSDKACDEVNKNEWVKVKGKNGRTSLSGVLRGTAAPGVTSLCAAERWRYLHLYYVLEGTTVEQVRAHLVVICGGDICTVEALKSRGRYSSFKLGVPSRNADSVMLSSNWAEDICVKPWRQNFRAKGNKTE